MKIFFLTLFTSFSFLLFAQEYNVSIDLSKYKNDKVPVELSFSNFEFDSVVQYQMPAMVPGMYSISDYGRTIDTLIALDIEGDKLKLIRLDSNRWELFDAKQLDKLIYWVDDTFDDPRFKNIFEPGGTNFEENNFLINSFGIVGFIEGEEKHPYSIHVTHPKEMYGTSPMKRKAFSETEETFNADNYLQLCDSPIMYCIPDTASVLIGDTKVMVSIYSPSGNSNAELMMSKIEPTLRAQGEYLGGDLPVDDYAILIYMHSNRTNSENYGALEHSYSTVFSYPDYQFERISQSIVEVTSHEFFHIITPLAIHSEEIGDYNFIEPKMSKHLWLYEGVTEYASMRMQVMYDLISPDKFLDEIVKKINGASRYNDTLPFTVMSKGALDRYEDQYGNVYEKGALIGMCFDLLLLELSDGEYDIRQLMNELKEIYGIQNTFKDDEFFDVIADLSFSETREFFNRYVEGSEPLPLTEYLAFAGVIYHPEEIVFINTLGSISLSFDAEKNVIVISNLNLRNDFGEEMAYKEGDILYKLMGREITIDNYIEVLDHFYSLNSGDELIVEVKRENKRGKEKIKVLKGKIQKIEVENEMYLSWEFDPTEKQSDVRSSWLNKLFEPSLN